MLAAWIVLVSLIIALLILPHLYPFLDYYMGRFYQFRTFLVYDIKQWWKKIQSNKEA